jgi:hypothetical protein
MVTRTWACLNRHCQSQFDHEADFPPCPRCGGIRVKWLPRPFGILSTGTRQADQTAKSLADDFQLTDFRSPATGRNNSLPHGAPAAAQNAVSWAAPGMHGWNLPADAQGRVLSACVPTGVTAKLSGQHIPQGVVKRSSTLGAAAQIAHVPYRPPGGLPGGGAA